MENQGKSEGPVITRRQLLAAAVGGATVVAGAAAIAGAVGGGSEAQARGEGQRTAGSGSSRLPTVYLPHGGGPWPFVNLDFGDKRGSDALAAYLRGLPASLGVRPRALLVVSAHWEEPIPTVMSGARPPMLYDYSGFPKEAYQITWPAPGNPELAARVQALLGAAGFRTASDGARGFDYGTFVPLKLAFPEADVPVVQLSLIRGLDPAAHLAMGRALAPLRDEGVLLVGSGMSYHNMRDFFGGDARAVAAEFDVWLQQAATAPEAERDRGLAAWASAPSARRAHPREEHLLPLMVIAGAGGADRGRVAYSDIYMGVNVSAVHYG